jgi:hypothetical protein
MCESESDHLKCSAVDSLLGQRGASCSHPKLQGKNGILFLHSFSALRATLIITIRGFTRDLLLNRNSPGIDIEASSAAASSLGKSGRVSY